MSPTSSDPSPSTLSPRACLANLPTEVKSRVAELCWIRDEWWRDYNEHLKEQFDATWAFGRELHALQSIVSKPYGRSLGALSLVSREWEQLTAPFRFRTVEVSKTSAVTFRVLIAPLRGMHIREIVFDLCDDNSFFAFLGYACAFTNMSRISITHWQAAQFCSKALAIGLAGQSSIARPAFAQLLSRVTSLYHDWPEVALPATFKLTCANLVSLRLSFSDESSINQQVNSLLQTARQLLHLDIIVPDSTLDLSRTSSANQSWARLQSVRLDARSIKPTTIAFLVEFSGTLRRLHVGWIRDPDARTDPTEPTFVFPPSSAFPCLQHITLRRCSAHAFGAIAKSLEPAYFPVLQGIEVCLSFEDYQYERRIIEDLGDVELRFRPTLLRIHFWYANRHFGEMTAYRTDFEFPDDARVTITPVTPYPHSAIADSDDFAQDGDSEAFEGPVRTAMSFLDEWHDRVVASKDADEYARLARALRMIELERVAQQC